MFIMSHRDDCAIVIEGPTQEGPRYKVADGRGGQREVMGKHTTVCSCDAVLIEVEVEMSSKKTRVATMVPPSGGSNLGTATLQLRAGDRDPKKKEVKAEKRLA